MHVADGGADGAPLNGIQHEAKCDSIDCGIWMVEDLQLSWMHLKDEHRLCNNLCPLKFGPMFC